MAAWEWPIRGKLENRRENVAGVAQALSYKKGIHSLTATFTYTTGTAAVSVL